MRSRRVFWAGDSGLLHYRMSGKGAKPTVDMAWVAKWDKLTISIGSILARPTGRVA